MKIIFNLGTPTALSYPWIFFDGLISHILLQDILGSLFDDLPPRVPLDFVDNLFLPIKRTNIQNDFIYHSSVSIFEHPNEFSTMTIHKQFGGSNSEENLKTNLKRVDIVRGPLKLFQLTYPVNNSKKVWFYVNGDRKKLEELLSYITSLGKKRDIGYGSIVSSKIEMMDSDESLIHEGKIMRTIPIEYCSELKIIPKSDNVALMNYKSPYWNKSNIKLCTIPEC